MQPINQMLVNQYEAVLAGINACIVRCPPALWSAMLDELSFDQYAFHALFYADLNLNPGMAGFREQRFHRDHAALFGTYEELEDQIPVQHYTQAFLRDYVQVCRAKVKTVLSAESAAVLAGPSGFPDRHFSRAELHVYTIRHLQDHVAQLGGFLERETGTGVGWVRSGWRDA